jgi:hypothetical protein
VDRKAVRGRARFRVRSYGPSGQLRFDRTYSHIPKPISRREVDSLVDVADYKWRNEAVGPGMIVPGLPKSVPKSTFRDGLYVPPYHPAVTAVAAGRDGTTWIRREDDGAAQVLWQALDGRGDVIGELILPSDLQLHDADAEHLWGVRILEFGVEEIVRYRIRRPG